MDYPIENTSIKRCPHAFIDKRSEPILIKILSEKRHGNLVDMYLDYEPRNSFNGLPPIQDEACKTWALGMIDSGLNLVAISFEEGIVGHVVLFAMQDKMCELMVVVTPEYQHVGIGSQLMRCAVRLAYELEFEKIWLCVESGNHIARHVYQKCGFDYLTRSATDDVEMALDLSLYRRVLDMSVLKVMNENVTFITTDISCHDAANIILEQHIAALPVVNDDHEVIGILSSTDLIMPSNFSRKITEVLTKEVVTVRTSSTIGQVIRLFQEKRLRYIPVVNDQKQLIGIVGRRDILSYYLDIVKLQKYRKGKTNLF
jgi:CBS domain-containing protein